MLEFLKLSGLTGLTGLVLLITLLSLHAQNDSCLRFEELPADAVYGRDAGQVAGDLAFSSKGVDVYLQEFLYSNSDETGFWNASVSTDIFGQQSALDGQSLFISNINLNFDFTQLDRAVNGLCFRIVDGGGEENIAVNGQSLTILPDFSEAPVEIAPGVKLSVNPLPSTGSLFSSNAEICLSGKIESLTIGGQEFALDNLCLFFEPCPEYEVKVEIVNCLSISDEVYVYELDVDLSLPSTANAAFDVYVDGIFRGFFSAADLPLRLEQIRVLNNQDLFEVKVCINDRPDCCVQVELPNSGCTTDCSIEQVEIGEIECSLDDFYYTKLNIKGSNVSNTVTITNEIGDTWTGPADGSELVKFPIPSQQYDQWTVCDTDNPNCCYTFDFDVPCSNCRIGPLQAKATECSDDGTFYIKLDFEHQNTSDKFQLLLNQEVYESYSYADLPVTVGPLPANTGQEWHVLVRDLSASTNTAPCASDAELPAVQCPGGECKIGELKLSEYYCTDDGEEFYVQLHFEHQNTADKFQLYLQDQLYGTFAYEELPLKLGPFNALIDIEWQLLVKDASGACAADISFSAPNCGDGGTCNLSNLVVERYPCIGGQFLVDLAFDIKNPGPEGYFVFADGEISGPHSYDQPYIKLGPFAGDGTTIYDFLVVDIADPSCYGYYELGPVDCSNPCTISEVKAEVRECNEDGAFLVDLSFNYDKVGGTGFTVRGNGVEYGQFAYGAEVYTIGPLAGDGSTVYEFVVIDNDNPDCRDFTAIDPVDCLPCSIGELEYTVQCLQNAQQFILNLDFDYKNPDSERFVLTIGDEVIGTFLYTDLPLSRELKLPENGKLIVSVWDSENTDCARKGEFTIPCCYLSDPVVEAYPCENNGELWVDLDLKYYNAGEAFQLVYGPLGGQLEVKEFAYADLPVQLGPLSGQTTSDWYFEVTDLGFFCQSSTAFSPEYCDNDACAEWDQTPPGAYGALTGYEPGDLIDEEDELRLSFAPGNQPDCNCSVFITKASTFPAFQAANGQLVLVDNSGALISAPGYEMQSLGVDYYFTGTEVLLKVNGAAPVGAPHPTELPEDIAPGIKLTVEKTSNDGSNGRMTFTGAIYRLSFFSRGKWALDNFCTEKTEKEDEVWPGDTNLDNVANHIDLLNIGLAFGEQGPVRVSTDISWAAQQAEDWNDRFFDNDLNYKHADADGDGTVNRADRGPILENYGRTHGPLPVFTEATATENDPPLYVDFDASSAPIPVGGTFQVPVVFGTATLPVDDIYGIAFTITFDPKVIDPAGIEVVYPKSWLGDTDNDLITLDRTLQEAGRINVALTRINKINVGGHGAIASLIGAIDDIAGKHTEVGITEVVAINANEDRVPVNGMATKVEFSEELKPDIGYIDLSASLNIFPNPTSGEVLITTRFNFPIERIRVLDGYGNPTGLQTVGKNRIDLNELPSGVYMLRIQLGKYTISRKVVKVR